MTAPRDPENVNGQVGPTEAELDASDHFLTEVARGSARDADPVAALLRTAARPPTASESTPPHQPTPSDPEPSRRHAWTMLAGRSVAAKVAIVAAMATVGMAGAGAATGIVAELRSEGPMPSTTAVPQASEDQREPGPTTPSAPSAAAPHAFGTIVATCLSPAEVTEQAPGPTCAALLERAAAELGSDSSSAPRAPTVGDDAADDVGTPTLDGDRTGVAPPGPGNNPTNNDAGGNNNPTNNPGQGPANNNAGGNNNPTNNPGQGPANNNAGGKNNPTNNPTNNPGQGPANNNAGGNNNPTNNPGQGPANNNAGGNNNRSGRSS